VNTLRKGDDDVDDDDDKLTCIVFHTLYIPAGMETRWTGVQVL
jgi:hypothetical protein